MTTSVEIKEADKTYTTKIYKNKMCNYGLHCKYINTIKPSTGYTCDFAHSEKEFGQYIRTINKVIPQNKYKIIPCFRELNCKISGCTYAHTPEELNLTYCNWGAYCGKTNCEIVHSEMDKKTLYDLIKQKFNIVSMSEFPFIPKKEKNTIKCEIITNKQVNIKVDFEKGSDPKKQSWADISDDELLENE